MNQFHSQNNRWKRQHIQRYIEAENVDSDSVDYEDCEEYFPITHYEPIKMESKYSYTQRVQLKGPRSPLESEVHSLLLHNGKCSVTIDAHSVNSVLLTSMQQVKLDEKTSE